MGRGHESDGAFEFGVTVARNIAAKTIIRVRLPTPSTKAHIGVQVILLLSSSLRRAGSWLGCRCSLGRCSRFFSALLLSSLQLPAQTDDEVRGRRRGTKSAQIARSCKINRTDSRLANHLPRDGVLVRPRWGRSSVCSVSHGRGSKCSSERRGVSELEETRRKRRTVHPPDLMVVSSPNDSPQHIDFD